MKKNFLKLPVAAILSMGLLLTVVTGTTLASEEGEEGSFWDHQEMAVSVYDGDLPDFNEAAVPDGASAFKKMVKSNGKEDSIQLSAGDLLNGEITIKRPVNLSIEGYDALSASEQNKIKLVIDLPDKLEEDSLYAMTILGLPEEHIVVRNLGPVSLYVGDIPEANVPEEDVEESSKEPSNNSGSVSGESDRPSGSSEEPVEDSQQSTDSSVAAE